MNKFQREYFRRNDYIVALIVSDFLIDRFQMEYCRRSYFYMHIILLNLLIYIVILETRMG